MRLSELNDNFPICENIEKKRPHLVKFLKKHALSDNNEYFDTHSEKVLDREIDQTINWVVISDPVAHKTNGRKTPFVNDIIQWLLDGKIAFPEDIATTREALAIYNQAKQHGSVKPISDFGSPGAIRKEYSEAEAESDTYEANAKLIDQDGEFKMYQIDDWNQGQICFADSGWCVQQEDYFDEYEPPYYMVTKGKKRYALIHVDSEQIKDVQDDPLSMEMALPIKKFILRLWPKYPVLDTSADTFQLAKFWPDGEAMIAKNADLSYHYAKWVIAGRFELGEPAIAKDPKSAYRYAQEVIKGKWPEGEDAIAKHPAMAYNYSKHVLKGRFPKGESIISKWTDHDRIVAYAKDMIKGRFPEAEDYIMSSPASAVYAKDVVKGPWPEAETDIAKRPITAYIYARDVIKRRFPEGEPVMAKNNLISSLYAKNIMKSPWPEAGIT